MTLVATLAGAAAGQTVTVTAKQDNVSADYQTALGCGNVTVANNVTATLVCPALVKGDYEFTFAGALSLPP